jgi:hypothetical protein
MLTPAATEPDAFQQIRARNALIRAVRTLLKGTGLDIRELASELVISNPGHPEHGRIYVNYISGDVSHRRTIWDYLGRIHGYGSVGPDAEPPVNAHTIVSLLTNQAYTQP